ncbi:hypothetical protein SOVF_075130 isoform B [Spinacia oleracea]|nr:hypothetical protein SOVF_075130 isoform B [Spinacia oleracea]
MPCSRKQPLLKLLYNVTATFKFFFLFFYLFSLFIAKLFTYFFSRTEEEEYEDDISYEDEDEDEEEEAAESEEEEEEEYRYSHMEEEEEEEGDHLVADIVNDGEGLIFVANYGDDDYERNNDHSIVHSNSYETLFQDPVEDFNDEAEAGCFENSPALTSSSELFDRGGDYTHHGGDVGGDNYDVINEDYASRFESNHLYDHSFELEEEEIHDKNDHENPHQECEAVYHDMPQNSPSYIEVKVKVAPSGNHDVAGEFDESKTDVVKQDSNFTRDEKFLIFAPPKSEAKKLTGLEMENEGIFEDTYTVGSTSKSSSEWRSSIRDSGTDDPFSSSSRRSCPKWESYAVYQKYDEEMTFLDRISAQKLHETESLRSIQVEPRSISQRIVHKLGNNKEKKSSGDDIYKNKTNPYNELEVAYVAQICLTWEALNWNYETFRRKTKQKSKTELQDDDHGCPANIAQQFQQFQVLVQRYIENEPYQRGKRPEIYARLRSAAPNLLQVPEYHDYEGEEKELVGGRIASALFLQILEDSIQTFMNFLKADRENHCQVITALFKLRPRGSIDPTVLNVFKKCNKKKKLKLKEVERTRKCFKKRRLTREEEMEILMSLIDLKVVSRVLRMTEITQEQLHWCEQKMAKPTILEGKLHRDSSPLFFPAH